MYVEEIRRSVNTTLPTNNFWSYLISQKKIILFALCISAVCFILLKYCFPYPDFFIDSTSYVEWAVHNYEVDYRPVGYSQFLRLVHQISPNSLFTVFIQYVLFFLSSLFCLFSIDYLFRIGERLKLLLMIVVLINPILILQANLISSDSLFCSLTVVWFTLCLWIIKKQNWWALFLQLLVLYLNFEVRYTALFYPVASSLAFVLCPAKLKYKFIGIALTLVTILVFINRQKDLIEEKTGTRVFSGFAGWQIANNVLYCYKNIDIAANDLPSKDLQVIDQYVKRYIDTIENEPGFVGTQYMWDRRSPLKQYQYMVMKSTREIYIKAWFIVSKPFNEYGWYIIRNYPKEFLRYYIMPNTKNYFYPGLEALASYNASTGPLPAETKEWFDFDTDNLNCRYAHIQESTMILYPSISLILNVFNIAAIFLFLFRALRTRKKMSGDIWRLFLFWSVFYFAFMAFIIFATPIVLRYLDPIFILGFVLPFPLLSYIWPAKHQKL